MNIHNKLENLVENWQNAASVVAVPESRNLEESLRRDPVKEAENIVDKLGLLGKTRDNTMFGISMEIIKEKARKLIETDDVTCGDSVERYHGIIESMGFKKVLEIPFVIRKFGNRPETLYMFWHSEKAILLKHDTFSTRVNGGNVYFNWRGKPMPERVSGGYYMKDSELDRVPYNELYLHGQLTTDKEVLRRNELYEERWRNEGVCVGHFDCREAVRYNVDLMTRTGTFIKPWVKQPSLWLLHHDDTEGNYDYNKINEERIAMLPKEVRDVITPDGQTDPHS